MKKILILLLTATMVFSLAACGGNSNSGGNSGNNNTPSGGSNTIQPSISGDNQNQKGEYDMEFTIYVGGEDEWEPFINEGFNLEFSNSDDSVLSIKAYTKAVEFKGLQVGESIITATFPAQNREEKALVRVRAVEGTTEKINYKYNPPTDNYFILFETQETGNTYELFGSKIGDVYCFGDEELGQMWRFSVPSGEGYYSTYNGGGWQESPDNYETEYIGIAPLDAMEESFVKYFRSSGIDGDALSAKLTEFYVKKETVCGISCWVFDTQGYNGLNMKFWIDPSNGCCLKYENNNSNSTNTVTEYDFNYSDWTGKYKP